MSRADAGKLSKSTSRKPSRVRSVAMALGLTAGVVVAQAATAGWTGVGDPQASAQPLVHQAGLCGVTNSMSVRDKLAQLLDVQVNNVGEATTAVRDHHVGAVFLGTDTSPGLLGGPINGLKGQAGPLPLMVTIDEEGGQVSRFPGWLPAGPSAWTIAHTMSPDQTYGFARGRADRLRQMGVTVNFAPDVDLTRGNAAIGDRSFGDDPGVVSQYAGSYARAMRDAGIQPVFKHFPGHGRASGDTHYGAAHTPSLAELVGADLVPFRNLLPQGGGVMIGHLDVPGLTNGVPASLSPAAYQLLRTGVGYAALPYMGPIFTDDLGGMAAISRGHDVPSAVADALEAGADVALFTNGIGLINPVLDRLQGEVASGRLSMAQVDASVDRIAHFKGAC